jgi:hypothetical protein
MRFYDLITMTEWDNRHPKWHKHNKNKDGSTSVNLKKEGLLSAMNSSQLALVPSVTTLTQIIDGYGAFGSGAAWGSKMTIQAMNELDQASRQEKFVARDARVLMTKQRDKGTRMHKLMESVIARHIAISKGETSLPPVIPVDATTKEMELAQSVLATIFRVVDSPIVSQEEVLGNTTFAVAGRCDLRCENAIVDFKFVDERSKPKSSEIVQVSTYAILAGVKKGFVIMARPDTGEVLKPWTVTGEEIDRFAIIAAHSRQLFCSLVDLWLDEADTYTTYLGHIEEKEEYDELKVGKIEEVAALGLFGNGSVKIPTNWDVWMESEKAKNNG